MIDRLAPEQAWAIRPRRAGRRWPTTAVSVGRGFRSRSKRRPACPQVARGRSTCRRRFSFLPAIEPTIDSRAASPRGQARLGKAMLRSSILAPRSFPPCHPERGTSRGISRVPPTRPNGPGTRSTSFSHQLHGGQRRLSPSRVGKPAQPEPSRCDGIWLWRRIPSVETPGYDDLSLRDSPGAAQARGAGLSRCPRSPPLVPPPVSSRARHESRDLPISPHATQRARAPFHASFLPSTARPGSTSHTPLTDSQARCSRHPIPDSRFPIPSPHARGRTRLRMTLMRKVTRPRMQSSGVHDLRASASVRPLILAKIQKPLSFIHDPIRPPPPIAVAR